MDELAKMLKFQKDIDELGGRVFEGSIDKVEAEGDTLIIHSKNVEDLLKFLVPTVHKRAYLAVVPKNDD